MTEAEWLASNDRAFGLLPIRGDALEEVGCAEREKREWLDLFWKKSTGTASLPTGTATEHGLQKPPLPKKIPKNLGKKSALLACPRRNPTRISFFLEDGSSFLLRQNDALAIGTHARHGPCRLANRQT